MLLQFRSLKSIKRFIQIYTDLKQFLKYVVHKSKTRAHNFRSLSKLMQEKRISKTKLPFPINIDEKNISYFIF